MQNVPERFPYKHVVIKNPEEIDTHQTVRHQFCKALKDAGFDSSWTMDRVMSMARNELMETGAVNIRILDQTNMNKITHSDMECGNDNILETISVNLIQYVQDQITVGLLIRFKG